MNDIALAPATPGSYIVGNDTNINDGEINIDLTFTTSTKTVSDPDYNKYVLYWAKKVGTECTRGNKIYDDINTTSPPQCN